jgi:RimJ/RimL family protein N-acetyltransferase
MPTILRPYTLADAKAFIAGSFELGPYQFAIIEQGRVVGSIELLVNEHKIGHIGYWCAPEARGKGVLTRALRRLCRFGLFELQLDRLELVTDPENKASQRVAQKVGFQREGTLRVHLPRPDGGRRDSVMFSLLPGELYD